MTHKQITMIECVENTTVIHRVWTTIKYTLRPIFQSVHGARREREREREREKKKKKRKRRKEKEEKKRKWEPWEVRICGSAVSLENSRKERKSWCLR